MKRKTLIALQGSIEKWEKIVNCEDVDKRNSNCPLCKRFSMDCCRGTKEIEYCPIANQSGMLYCAETPYDMWSEVANVNKVGDLVNANALTQQAAEAELAYLQSLLPKDTNNARKL